MTIVGYYNVIFFYFKVLSYHARAAPEDVKRLMVNKSILHVYSRFKQFRISDPGPGKEVARTASSLYISGVRTSFIRLMRKSEAKSSPIIATNSGVLFHYCKSSIKPPPPL